MEPARDSKFGFSNKEIFNFSKPLNGSSLSNFCIPSGVLANIEIFTVILLLALGLENHNYNDSGFSFFVFAEFRARLSLRIKLGILIVGDS